MKKILLTLILATVALAGQASANGQITSRWNDPGFQKQAIDLLEVSSDGTVRVRDWMGARRLLGRDYGWAMADLVRWNRRVREGIEPGLTPGESLASHAIVLNESYLAEMERESTSGTMLASTAPNCRGGWIGKCTGGVCCCGGWWFFCTQYCTCH